MTFDSRKEAGYELGRRLAGMRIEADLVLGLPRGGVIVAAEVASILNLPLGVLVARKIGHPRFREFAVGAIAEEEIVLLDDQALAKSMVDASELEEVVREEKVRLEAFTEKLAGVAHPSLEGKRVILVDDGLATGATTEAAVCSAKRQGAARVIVAVPVGSVKGKERVEQVSDLVVALLIDPEFEAVGQYYQEFSQATDEEVLQLLARQ
jgi:putative phosphoribosyl transferase